MTKFTGALKGYESGQFASVAEMTPTLWLEEGMIVEVFDNKTKYYITVADEGEGILLTNGLYANPPAVAEVSTVLPKLAPDLNYVADKAIGTATYTIVTGIDGSSGFVPALSLIGSFSIEMLEFTSVTTLDTTVRLTVDGVEIWNSLAGAGTSLNLISDTVTVQASGTYMCEESFLLEVATVLDNNITLNYRVVPIL